MSIRRSEGKKDGDERLSATAPDDEDALTALMTEMAIKEDAQSASTSTIQDDIVQTLHQIEVWLIVIR